MRPLPVNELVHCIVICVAVSQLSMMREIFKIFIVIMTHVTVMGQVFVLVGISVVVCELIMVRHAMRESNMVWQTVLMITCLLKWIVSIMIAMMSLCMFVAEVMIVLVVLIMVIVAT